MKFFAALLAKLTGGDTSPKTLDQARSTFTEAKAALDRFGALFAAASIDLDALLAKGDNALKDYVAELNQKAATAEAAVLEAKNALTAAEQKAVAAEAKSVEAACAISCLTSALSAIGFTPKADAKPEEVQAAFKLHISGAVTQQLAELGQPAAKLPASASATTADTEADLLAQLADAKTPAAKGIIAAKLNALRDASWGKN
jgi:hypothetical protein